MTQPDIFTLPSAELRGYVRGLREAAANIPHMGLLGAPTARASLLREADLVEGFAARLEAAAPQIAEEASVDKTRAVHTDAPAPSQPTDPLFCWPYDAECPPGCDGNPCERARHAAASVLHELEQRAAGTHRETAPTDEEQTQTGLADAVAEDLPEPEAAQQPELQAEAAEPQAPPPAPAISAWGGTLPIWTEARLELLRRLYPTLMHLDEIHAALNALPGQPIASPGSTKVKACSLNLHRRGEPIPQEFAHARETGRLGRKPSMTQGLPNHAQSRTENGAKPGTWTAERERLLRRDYPTDMPPADILQAVNALPGPPVVSVGAVYAHAKKLGLIRRQPPAVGEPIAPAVTTKPIELTTEEMHELRETFRKKKFGVTWLREEWGLPEGYAQQIVQQLRDEAAKRKAA